MPKQNDIEAGELNASHLGHRIFIKRADHAEVLVGQLVAVDHRPVNGRPGEPVTTATEVSVRWQPEIFFRVALAQKELVTILSR